MEGVYYFITLPAYCHTELCNLYRAYHIGKEKNIFGYFENLFFFILWIFWFLAILKSQKPPLIFLTTLKHKPPLIWKNLDTTLKHFEKTTIKLRTYSKVPQLVAYGAGVYILHEKQLVFPPPLPPQIIDFPPDSLFFPQITLYLYFFFQKLQSIHTLHYFVYNYLFDSQKQKQKHKFYNAFSM